MTRVPHCLERESFSEDIELLAAVVPLSDLNSFVKTHRLRLLQRSNTKPVVESSQHKGCKLVLLSEPVETHYLIEKYNLHIPYNSLTFSEVVNKLLPDALRPGPSSFETIGHIAHFNLDGYLDPDSETLTHYSFRHLIAQVCLDKFPNIRTVVHKEGSISSEFRVFDMAVLAGEDTPDLTAIVKEGGMTFIVPYRHVYWNSRLSYERERVISFMNAAVSDGGSDERYLVDMFAGVGALACMAAKAGYSVVANDLNPAGAAAIRENSRRNRVHVDVHNLDAREFVKAVVPPLVRKGQVKQMFFMMNLPEIAIEFMDVFPEILANLDCPIIPDMWLMCHCFARADPPEEEIFARVKAALHLDLKDLQADVVLVRDVAPNKKMYCVNLNLRNALTSERRPKRPRVDC